jgi:small basic protein
MPVMSFLAGLAGYLLAKPFKSNFFISGVITAAIIAVSLSYMFEQFGMGSMFVMLPYLFVVEQILCIIGASVFTLINRRYVKW